MGAITYFHFRAARGRNAKTPWAIAANLGGWMRSATLRGWNWGREVYVRPTTAGEDIILSKMFRYFGGRYENLERLLEDEREILGANSDDYKSLEDALIKHEGVKNMPTTKTAKKTKDGTLKVTSRISNKPPQKTAKENKNEPAGIFNSPDVFALVERAKISLSPTNPRKRIDTGALDELAESIRRVGVLEPPLVRKIPVNTEHRKLMTAKFEAAAELTNALGVYNAAPENKNSSAYSKALEKYSTAEGNLTSFERANEENIRYEMIAGERRWRAAEIAGVEKLSVIIKEVSDDAVLEIQIIENLQRKDVHPIDECAGYERLQSELKWTEDEIALRVGKPTSYITGRLKLKTLNPKARELFEKNELMLSHALEIAKYPVESQDEILEYAFNNFGYATQTLFPMPKFIGRIQQHFLLQLKKAPFSTKATDLRSDGLACVKCPERTNANPLLFAENFSDKDCCLNRNCWEAKTMAHIQIQKSKIAEADVVEKVKTEYQANIKTLQADISKSKDASEIDTKTDAVERLKNRLTDIDKKGIDSGGLPSDPVKLVQKSFKNVKLIAQGYISESEKPKGEKLLTTCEYQKLDKKDECESAEKAVYFNGDRVGQTQLICADKNCKKHLGKYSSQSVANSASNSGEALMIRKEELLDAKVAENTRRRVLKKAAEKFDAAHTIFTHKNADGYATELLTRLWKLQCSYSEHTALIIREILEIEKDKLSTSRWSEDFHEQIGALSEDERSKLTFLLLTAHECEIYESNWAYKSQKNIQDLARDFDVDYKRIDAEERLGAVPMKFKDVHRNYLQEVESGNQDAKIPRVYSDKWKPKD